MLILRDNELINVSLKEDLHKYIIAYKSLEQLKKEGSSHATGPIIYKIICLDDFKWNAIVYVSQYSDNSSLDNYYTNKTSLGGIINTMLDDNFEIYNELIQITK